MTVGVRRVRIGRWLPDDPYPIADVEEWPDDPPSEDAGDRCTALATELRRILALASELGEHVASATDVDVDDDPVLASYQLVGLAPFGSLDRLALLAAPSVGARLDLLASLLLDLELVIVSRLERG